MFMLFCLFLCCICSFLICVFVSPVDTLCIYFTYYFCFCQSIFMIFFLRLLAFTVFGIFILAFLSVFTCIPIFSSIMFSSLFKIYFFKLTYLFACEICKANFCALLILYYMEVQKTFL